MAADEIELDVRPAQEAVLAVLDRLAPLRCELVKIDRGGGRSLAEPLHARGPLPSAPLSIMDGYAVRSSDLRSVPGPIELSLAGESAAGHPFASTVASGSCVRISTGAVVPAGADAVVAQEDTRRLAEAVEFSPLACMQIEPGRFIRPIGSDVGERELLLAAGTLLGPGELALLGSCGHVEIPVCVRPKVAILASGDELLELGSTPGLGQIIATNGMMLAEQIVAAGGEPIDLGLVPDRPEALREAASRAMREADLLVGTGGISVGDHDLVLPVLRELGIELHFRRVRLRPGRPSSFGLLPRTGAGPLPVLALPGNPAATLVAFELLARPLLLALLGFPRRRRLRPQLELELAEAIEGDRKREHYARVRIDDQGRAVPLDHQLSGSLRSIADFDALAIVPAGRDRVAAGERLQALLLR